MRSTIRLIVWAISTRSVLVYSLSQHSTSPATTTAASTSRRSLLRKLWNSAAVGTLLTTATTSHPATATAASDVESVYYGVGCFWHIQHEFVEAERKLLGRNDHELTSASGYAGGKSTGAEGQVCYHNLRGIADYG